MEDSGERMGGKSRGPGDFAALAFRQFRTGLHRYLLQRLRSADNAEDLAQEVYLRLLRATDMSKVKFPQAYVYRIAFHVLYEFRVRERGGRVDFDSDAAELAAEHWPDESAEPETAYEDHDKQQRLERIMNQLPPMQRAVLRLATQHNRPHAEIAKDLGLSVSTVRNHLYRAIDFCRHRLSEEAGSSQGEKK